MLSDSRGRTTPLRAPAYFHIGVWVGESLVNGVVVFVFCELRYVVLIGSSAAWELGPGGCGWGLGVAGASLGKLRIQYK